MTTMHSPSRWRDWPHPEYLSDRGGRKRRRECFARSLIWGSSTAAQRRGHIDLYLGKWSKTEFISDLLWMREKYPELFPDDLRGFLRTYDAFLVTV